jgi:hypothetical protein
VTDLICSLTNSRPANCKDTYCLGLKVPETCAVISSVGWVFDFANKHQCLFLLNTSDSENCWFWFLFFFKELMNHRYPLFCQRTARLGREPVSI